MRILLVSANREKNPYPVAPLGLLYLAEALMKEKIEVFILDLCFSSDISEDIKKTIDSFHPDVIGISIRNIDNLSYPGVVDYLPDIKNIVDIIRSNLRVPIILGGSAFSLFPEEILRYTGCNMGVIGEGERAFVQLVKKIEIGKDEFSKIDNVIWLSDRGVHRNRVSYVCTNNFAVKRDLINNGLYSKYGGMGNIQTKRGCQFNCSYCTYPLLEGKGYRLRSPDVIAEEVELSQNAYHIKHFFFVDSVFNYPIQHALQICKSIIKRKLNLTWSCFASPFHITKELLTLMKEAGCMNIEFGTDALSWGVLQRLRKDFTIDDIFIASKLCKDVGIKCAHYVMFGGPGETKETLHQSFKRIDLLECTAIIAMVGIRIYPGTILQALAIEEGIISSGESLLKPRFYLTSKIPLEILIEEVTNFAAGNHRCIVPGLGIRSSEKMLKILRRYYEEGPLWAYLG